MTNTPAREGLPELPEMVREGLEYFAAAGDDGDKLYVKAIIEHIKALSQPTQGGGEDAWKDAVLDELAVCAMDAPLDESPKSILRRVIAWHVQASQDLSPADSARVIRLAYDAMNYMGDIINGHDMTQPEDEEKCTPAFEAVREYLAGHSTTPPPPSDAAQGDAWKILDGYFLHNHAADLNEVRNAYIALKQAARPVRVDEVLTVLDLLRTDRNGKKWDCIQSASGSMVDVSHLLAAHKGEGNG